MALSCEECHQMFLDERALFTHLANLHKEIFIHSCHLCHSRYREKDKLTRHLKRVHQICGYNCPGCQFQANSQNELDSHILEKHKTSRFFECHLCLKSFTTLRYLKRVHTKRCHVGPEVHPRRFLCTEPGCAKSFRSAQNLRSHTATHLTERNYGCGACGAQFRTKYQLDVHANAVHTHLQVFSCSHCPATFTRQSNLCSHIKKLHREHGATPPFLCDACGQMFSDRRVLHKHQRVFHGSLPPVECHDCGKHFTTAYSLAVHTRTHTGQRPYVCMCGTDFTRRSSLRRHQALLNHSQELTQNMFNIDSSVSNPSMIEQSYVTADHVITNETLPHSHHVISTSQDFTHSNNMISYSNALSNTSELISENQGMSNFEELFNLDHLTAHTEDPLATMASSLFFSTLDPNLPSDLATIDQNSFVRSEENADVFYDFLVSNPSIL